MAEGYIGEIRMFAAVRNQAPIGWLFCDGSLQSIATYQALYSLLGTTYGGDGMNTFGLPDYRSRLPIGMGQEGVNPYPIGTKGGLEQVPLTTANMPGHTHYWYGSTVNATDTAATGKMFGTVPVSNNIGGLYEESGAAGFTWFKTDNVIGNAGTPGASHENRMPAMAISFIIAFQGIYPVRG